MQTFSETHTGSGRRLDAHGLIAIVLVTLAIAIAAVLTVLVLNELLALAADPVQVAPVRWIGRM